MNKTRDLSEVLFEKAKRCIPGGVNSPVRAFRAVGGHPIFFHRAKGAHIFDVSNKLYIDYVLSWGAMLLGHSHEEVNAAIVAQLGNVTSLGAPTKLEIDLAEKICNLIPGVESIRMVNSGTEATMSAIRLARGYTGRDKIIKFEGCYHGHADSLLVKAGSGALTFGVPSSPGIPASLAENTITLSYNDIEEVNEVMRRIGEQIACIIVEPVAGNMNCVPPISGFLEALRECCTANGTILIMDEVMTGFRVGPQGATGHYGVTGDLICLGKVIGGGMPVGAFGGKREIMNLLSPEGPVYQAGTLAGNPISMASGLATLKAISAPNFFDPIIERTNHLVEGLIERAHNAGIPLTGNQAGTMWGIFFTEENQVYRYDQVVSCDTSRFSNFFHGMLEQGIYLAPASFEAGFMSAAHSEQDIENTLDAATTVFKNI
ncbi:MAG: glutamate-1-semialdehyde-2,1-aminomutase [Cellvibrionales bacterium TMED148]|nr:glutamate-1-semialdehyde-2,1-aminomutase [Porticoccaceae bacterium]RPG88680.1 MAG: glutamate-1-semialdehyde-2,1-aminomutase [Cellvibrionales bacterium TMED148]